MSKFGEQPELFKEDFRFNMGSYYMAIIADVIKATSVASLNDDMDRLIKSTQELFDVTAPLLTAKNIPTKDLKDSINTAMEAYTELKGINSEQIKAQKHREIKKRISECRSQILIGIRHFLMPIEREFTPEGALKEALGVD
jgi:phosphatidylinositol kinase/protein kinase (PI-3  family)